MSAIINALFGTYPEGEQQTTTIDTNQIAASSECLHTSATADNVQVNSVISTETQANATSNIKLNIDALLAQLNTTHSQVDQYSQTQIAEINEQVKQSIAAVLENTQRQQEELLADANRRHLIIDNDYKLQLQKTVEVLDGVKAKALADLEHDLHEKQRLILNEAKKQIDILNDQANAAKLNALVHAQEQAKQDIDNLTNQVAAIGQQETENVLQSTTTTIITSEAQAAETIITAPVTETTTTVITPEGQSADTIVTAPVSETTITTTTDNQLNPVPTAIDTTTQENTTAVDTVIA
jgi:hypothetical protein